MAYHLTNKKVQSAAWTDDEKRILLKLGNGLSIVKAREVLPNRTDKAIKRMCNLLGISCTIN